MKSLKRIILLLMSLSIIASLCSCSSSKIKLNLKQSANNYIMKEDCQNFISEMSSLVMVENGYYFTSDSKLFFFESETHKAYPVCSKANCDHSDTDCLAYLSPLKFYPEASMYYYDNALYLLGREEQGVSAKRIYIYQISLDNFKQKKAAYLFEGTSDVAFVCALHRGYVYFTYDGGDMEETTATLYRTKLGSLNYDSPEKIFEFSGIGASIARISARGNNIFFNTSSYEDIQGNGYKTTLNYMNIHTLEKATIPERKYSHFADTGRVYYCKDESTIAFYDTDTQEHKDFCTIDGPCYISADDNYIYFDNLQSIIVGMTEKKNRKIIVYDKSGNYVTSVVPKSPDDDCFFGGNDIMFFKENTYEEAIVADFAKGYYMLDKSQLTSSDKQFINME